MSLNVEMETISKDKQIEPYAFRKSGKMYVQCNSYSHYTSCIMINQKFS